MEAAKAAINKFTNKRGERTDVDETVAAPVISETIKPHQHEEITQAVDREVHQHHYHTTVQPIQDKKILPEQHTHVTAPVKEREFQHGKPEEAERKVSSELSQFKDTTTTLETHHTKENATAVTGEHVHHHVHETVQPVIHQEVIQPEVVHTTVPIHEVHYQESQHHGMSKLPMKTLEEFKKAGGEVSGEIVHRHEEYNGPPRPYNEKLQVNSAKSVLTA